MLLVMLILINASVKRDLLEMEISFACHQFFLPSVPQDVEQIVIVFTVFQTSVFVMRDILETLTRGALLLLIPRFANVERMLNA
jgi:hypothetical protein